MVKLTQVIIEDQIIIANNFPFRIHHSFRNAELFARLTQRGSISVKINWAAFKKKNRVNIENTRHLNWLHQRFVSVHKDLYLSSYSVCTQVYTYSRFSTWQTVGRKLHGICPVLIMQYKIVMLNAGEKLCLVLNLYQHQESEWTE